MTRRRRKTVDVLDEVLERLTCCEEGGECSGETEYSVYDENTKQLVYLVACHDSVLLHGGVRGLLSRRLHREAG
ncbi:hypothetical protein Pyrfu_0545 [Pyrolobus fumarii 1A]|uniref:Uncharacterized protein n=1 Tax=Pyrolobus fumarii (strain DSM 11204 / 1A) TaxID=694429 RepID=G0EGW6_PYRF1|nr:hypothetical protein [Pyrolobus fumarii]AEM38416.1 hypothetical protein Pyrfu_0545 [Pyrolobus fumarii 1A]